MSSAFQLPECTSFVKGALSPGSAPGAVCKLGLGVRLGLTWMGIVGTWAAGPSLAFRLESLDMRQMGLQEGSAAPEAAPCPIALHVRGQRWHASAMAGHAVQRRACVMPRNPSESVR